MDKEKMFLYKYNNSILRQKVKNVSRFLDEIMQKYIKAICRQFPVDEKCIDNLLCIDNIIVEPIKFADKGHAGVLISGIDENPFEHNFTLKIFPNIDMSYLKNQIPNNLTENEVDLYKKDALKNIIVFLHELTHSFGYIKFLKYSTEKNNYTLLTKEDISKENYTFYVERGGLIVGKTIVQSGEKIKESNLGNIFLYEAMTEFVAHNVLLDEEFQDLQYLYLSTGKIDPYKIAWAYSPFINIIFVLNYLYNNAFSVSYFTGDTEIAGFSKDIFDIDIEDIYSSLNAIIDYFNRNNGEEIKLKKYVHKLKNGIKKFLYFIEKELQREDVKKYMNKSNFNGLNNEIKNVCSYNDYINFILGACEIKESDFIKLKQIFKTEFQNLKATDVKNFCKDKNIH